MIYNICIIKGVEIMKSFVSWMDNLPLWAKIVLALPVLDIMWAVYRILKGAAYAKTGILLGGILWLLLGWGILWIIDIISIAIKHNPVVLA